MTFLNTSLPQQVEIGATRIDAEEIEIVTTDGLWEVRNARHSQSLRSFQISFPPSAYGDSVTDGVKDLFKVARGALHTFGFRDYSEYTLTAENIGTGDGSDTTFQITKTYTVGSDTHVRNITRPVSGILVYKNGVLQTITTHYTITLGLITFVAAPTAGHAITVTGEYDIPVRFDVELPSTGLSGFLEHIDTFTLKEVRE